MIGNSGSALVLEAIESGLGEHFDVRTIQSALLKQSTQPVPTNARTDCEHYLKEGYVSMEASDVSASLTVTFAYDDFVLAGISKYVGDLTSSGEADKRSKNYEKVWSPDHGYICPKSVNGTFYCPKTSTGPDAW